MAKRSIVRVLFVTVVFLVLGLGLLFFHKYNSRTTAVSDDKNLDKLQVLDACLLTTSQSCFPNIMFDSFQGKERLLTKSDVGELNKPSIESILFGDDEYDGYWSVIGMDQINGKGLAVDYPVNHGFSNNINPLVITEVAKLVMEKRLEHPDPTYSFSDYQKLTSDIADILSQYRSMFSQTADSYKTTNGYISLINQKQEELTDQIFLKTRWSPIQKAIILFFMVRLDASSYQHFLTSFMKKIPPAEATLPIRYVPNLPSKESRVVTKELHIVFCNPDKATLRMVSDCVQEGNGFICTSPENKLICNNGYWLDVHTKYVSDPPWNQ